MVRSLNAKIALVYLLLLLVLGVTFLWVTTRSYTRYYQEADQRLNQTLAESLANEFKPFMGDSVDIDGIKNTMHYLMVMNPRVEIYLLNETGKVLAFFADPSKVKEEMVDLEPIQAFLADDATLPIVGDDPRHPGISKPFSVVPVDIDSQRRGYVYVILAGEDHDSALAMIQDSYIARVTATGVVLLLIFTGGIGLLLFFLTTKRFKRMTSVVQRFSAGSYAERVPVRYDDEVGQLGQAFNQMADTIVANMEELRRTDDLRKELIANVSHDLRSPLASIQGYVETILIKEPLTDHEREHYLQVILDNTTRLNRLVNELFELSRLDALQIQPALEPFSIAELTQDVVLKFRPQAEKLGLTLDAPLPQTLPMVYADIGMIERVLSNLISNALRYTPEGGTVRVAIDAQREGVQVQIADTGYGIPADDLPFVWDRFYRVDKSRARTSGGSGLGLAIAKKILELHESVPRIESTVNVGTTISFKLRLA